MSETAMQEQKFDYSKAIKELEEIAQKVENSETSLDDIGKMVKRSTELIKACRDYIRSVREGVQAPEQTTL